MKTSIIVALFATVLFSCQKQMTSKLYASSTNNVSQEKHSNIIIPLDDEIYNPCTREDVHLTGYIRTEGTTIFSGSLLNITSHFNYDNVKATSISGRVYHVISNSHLNTQAVWDPVNGYYVTKNNNFSYRILLATPDGGNNMYSLYTFKLVANANGRLIISDEKMIYDSCR